MSLLQGIVMLLAFLIAVWVIFRGTSPIIVLLALAIAWTVLAGAGFRDLLANVLQKGGEQYASTVIVIVFGAWFGQILVQTGIAESMIRTAVELAGDRPIAVAWSISLITAVLFTSIYGVGAAIAIGVIAIPIMLSLGIPARVAAPAFTMAIGSGNYLNPVEFGIFKNFFKGIEYAQPYFTFYVIGFVVYLLMAFAMSAWHLRGVQVRRASAVATTMVTPRRVRVPWVSYLAPLVPVFVIIAFKWPLIPAFLLAIAFALVTTQGQRTVRATVDLFHKTFYDAFPDIATIAALWIICGMLNRRRPARAGEGGLESRLRADHPAHAVPGHGLLRPPGASRHLSRAVQHHRHWRRPAGRHAQRRLRPAGVPLPALAGPALPAGQPGSDELVDAVDHRLYEGLPRRLPENGAALRLGDGGHQRGHRLRDVRRRVHQVARWAASSGSASTSAAPSRRP